MVILAYLLGFVHTHMGLVLGIAVASFVLWGICAKDGRPAALRALRLPLVAILLASVAALAFVVFDQRRAGDGVSGDLIASHGEPAKIELVTKTSSSRTVGRRSSASIKYDVVYRYADGSTVAKNIDILDLPATAEGWRVMAESKVFEARCLPNLREACAVVGRAA